VMSRTGLIIPRQTSQAIFGPNVGSSIPLEYISKLCCEVIRMIAQAAQVLLAWTRPYGAVNLRTIGQSGFRAPGIGRWTNQQGCCYSLESKSSAQSQKGFGKVAI
jgi:hypothetical protein